MFLALRDLRRAWRRFSLVGLVVALVAVLATVLAGLADGLVQQGTSGLRAHRLGGSDIALPVLGFTFAGSYGHVDIAYTSLATWQSIAYGSDGGGRFSAIALDVPAGTDIAAIDKAAGTQTKTKQQAYDGSPGFTAETQTMTLIRAFLLVISALIVGAFFTVLAVQRTKQIGLLKAMGASSWYVLRDGIAQMALVVIVATAVGAAAGTAIVTLLDGGTVPVALAPSSILATAALIVLTGILGSLAAFRRITRVEPAIALGVSA